MKNNRLWKGAVTTVALLLAGLCMADEAASRDSLNDAVNDLLTGGCAGLGVQPGNQTAGLGSELAAICTDRGGSGTGASGSGSNANATITQQSAVMVLERLERLRMDLGGDDDAGGGASADTGVQIGDRLSLWFNAGANHLDHNNNRFEEGYDAKQPIVTVGADYAISSWLVAGLAFNYIHTDGDYNSNKNFNSNSFGPIVYASLQPIENSFVDVAFNYTRQDGFQQRKGAFDAIRSSGEVDEFGGTISANRQGNTYGISTLAGYDYSIKNFTIGPRLGFSYTYYDVDNFKENGNTGLEVKYSGLDRTSVQSSLGAAAMASFSVPFGVIVPQLNASWIHEYALNERNAEGRFAQDNRPDPTKFKFTYYEAPARNYAVIDFGVSAVLPNGWQPFVNFTTMQGNDNLTTYGGFLGLRVQM